MIDGTAAARWLLNQTDITPSRCLYWVWLAYKAQGASTGRGAATAAAAWGDSDGQHPGDRNPPAGAAVWWGRRYSDGNEDGDVTISLGDGRVAATDYPGWRETGTCTLDEREDQIGREYLGWTSSIFDCPISLPTYPGKDNIPTASAPTVQEDDMHAIRKAGVPDSGIIIQAGVPPYSLGDQVFQALVGAYGLTVVELADWQYETAQREQWTAFSTAQRFAKDATLSQADIDKIANATRDALGGTVAAPKA